MSAPSPSDVIGVDLGATGIKAARVNASHRVVARANTPTPVGREAVLAAVTKTIDELRRGARARAVGIGSCGMIDPVAGKVIESTETMPDWEGTLLAEEIAERTRLPCACDNDGNATALAEAKLGDGARHAVVAALTLGTGVGGGVVIHGRILHGAGFMAGKLGHLTVVSDGRKCACGARGCLEAYASAWALRRAWGADANELFRAARDGDETALTLVADAGRALGAGFAQIAHAVNPGLIVIGGGLARSWGQLAHLARTQFHSDALPAAFASTTVRTSELGNDAGVLGAALLAPASK